MRSPLPNVVSIVALTILAAVGCRGAGFAGTAKTQASSSPQAQQQELVASTTNEQNTDGKSQEEALAEVLDKLTEKGSLDAKAKRLLMADLREAKRENWPLIVQQFQATLAYREQLLAREEKASVRQLAAEKKTELVVAMQTTQPPRPTVAKPADSRPTAVPVAFNVRQAQEPENPSVVASAEPKAPLVLDKPPQQVAQQVNFVTNIQQPHDWQGHLRLAVQDLRASVQSSPTSTDEVNQHLRLRLLQLLAGDEEAALQPTPGATAPQQDYWNKQLFAVSTFLDSKRQPDDRRRAAGSLMHLDQARSKLAELATLEVRKLAFVDSVQGYGDYQLHKQTIFRPGDIVTLYAEIENFSSESTKEGYRTRLGTSYEVVDKSGKRVDSAQFPEVEDLCQNPRRDFHMQYTVTLPTRIYPEHYKIRLIITDQQSHKIGQASLPFEISE